MDKDKKNYIDTLKSLNLRPNKVKVKETKEEILLEVDIPEPNEILQELFIQMGEISSMSTGPRKDITILRLAIIAEYDAASLYEKMAGEVSDINIRKVLLDIANEEKKHIGEFEFLLERIDPDHERSENGGEEEVMDLTGIDKE
jgi:hypothetical protein